MGVYFPQAAVLLRIRFEDKSKGNSNIYEQIHDVPIICKNITVNINDYTQADTFKLEIDYKNFPFDPRYIRAVAATIAMEDRGRIFEDDNSLSVVKIKRKVHGDNVIFIGFADEEKINFDDTRRTVTLEGRDYTALLIDKKYNKGAISLDKKIDEVILEVLKSSKDTEDIILDNRVNGELPILSKFWGEKDLLSGKRNSVKDETYWDVIQDIIRRAGLIAYIELDSLVISKPRNLYDANRAVTFVYGRNLTSLEYSRKVGRKKSFNLLLRSLNLNTKEVIEAKIPAEATNEWSEATGIANTEVKLKKIKADGTTAAKSGKNATDAGIKEQEETAPYMSFIVPDVVDKDHLIEIGQQTYEEIGRQEIEGSLTTKEMFSSDNRNEKFDLLKIRNGTPIQIFLEQGDLKQLINFRPNRQEDIKNNFILSNSDIDSVAKYLTARGWNKDIASVFASKINFFGNIFYTRSVEFTLDNANGFNMKIDFINFVETLSLKKAGQ